MQLGHTGFPQIPENTPRNTPPEQITRSRWYLVQLELTDEAELLLREKGGTLTVDYIRPTG